MRDSLCCVAALALLLLSPPAAHADAARQMVLQTRAADASPHDVTAAAHERLGERLASRLDSLGLTVVASLADGLPSRAATSTPGGPRPAAAAFYDLDPARVWLIEARDSTAAHAAARALARDPAIEWIEPNPARQPALVSLRRAGTARGAGDDPDAFPSDPLFRDSRQWGLRNLGPRGVYGGVADADIGALEAWERSRGSAALRLAIADTGIDPHHPELEMRLPDGGSRLVRGANVTGDPTASFADSFGHGTPVAGVMVARTGEGAHFDSLGIAGVCGGDGAANPGCHIVPIKITSGHTGGASGFDIARAILHATDAGARAMNLSFGGSGPSRLERNALYHAITHGCVVVAAAGNNGDRHGDQPVYPAAYAADGLCVQAGASDGFDRRAGFSSHGPGLDVLAPGVSIWTTYMTYPSAMGVSYRGYVVGSGTSFAAPFVTGAIGLLAAARPELSDTDFQQVLRASAHDLGPPGWDPETGWGRLDAAAALRAVDREYAVWHDEALADRFQPGPVDTLVVEESGPGTMDRPRSWPGVRAIEATARVALPDSFLDPVRVWPRVGGTMTVRGDFRLPYFAPWAEVTSLGPDAFTLRGYLYQTEGAPEGDRTAVPLPLDQARFGFTVMGRVDRPPSLEVLSPAGPSVITAGDSVTVSWRASDPDVVSAIELWLEGGTTPLRIARVPGGVSTTLARIPAPAPFEGAGTLRVVALDEHGRRHDRTMVGVPIRLLRGASGQPPAARLTVEPNPFVRHTRIRGPAGAAVRLIDVGGRVVRRARLDGSVGAFVWDGRDPSGRALRPGVYFVECEGPGNRMRTKVLKLE